MTTKKTKPKKIKAKKSKGSKQSKPKTNNSHMSGDSGIVVIDDDIKIDKSAELEARKAYLEESRSQESTD